MLSRGRCYVPTCHERVIRMVDGEPSVNIQVAHIRAHSAGGPRFDPDFPRDKRRGFANLILLCQAHHSVIDKKRNEDRYPASLLLDWKEQREGDFSKLLDGLDVIGQDSLAEMLAESVGDTKDELMSAIDEMASTVSEETARTLRGLVAETFDRPYLDIDAVSSLADSARVLANLEDSASMLSSAACRLGNLEDNSSRLAEAAESLGSLEDQAATLYSAASEIRSAASEASSVSVLDGFGGSDVESIARELRQSVKTIEEVSQTISAESGTAFVRDDDRPWRFFKAGLAVGAGTVILLVVILFLIFQGKPSGASASPSMSSDKQGEVRLNVR